jgi:hypothetical protein
MESAQAGSTTARFPCTDWGSTRIEPGTLARYPTDDEATAPVWERHRSYCLHGVYTTFYDCCVDLHKLLILLEPTGGIEPPTY